jgi:hypothetical protein
LYRKRNIEAMAYNKAVPYIERVKVLTLGSRYLYYRYRCRPAIVQVVPVSVKKVLIPKLSESIMSVIEDVLKNRCKSKCCNDGYRGPVSNNERRKTEMKWLISRSPCTTGWVGCFHENIILLFMTTSSVFVNSVVPDQIYRIYSRIGRKI